MWWDRSNTIYDPVSDTTRPEDPGADLVRRSKTILDNSCEERQAMAEAALYLYFGNDRHSLRGSGYGRVSATEFGGMTVEPPGYNVVQACVDTKTAHIVRNKVRPLFLTEAGDPELQEKAKGMQRGVEAIFDQVGIYGDAGMSVCRDGNLFDGGFMKFTVDYANNRMLGERVLGHDLMIPEREALLGNPRQIGHRVRCPRDALTDLFQDAGEDVLDAIRNAPPSNPDIIDLDNASGGTVSDMVEAYEWWHLPSGRVDLSVKASFGIDEETGEFDSSIDPGHDGRRVICIGGMGGGATLLDEPWPFGYFPIAKFLPQKNPEGVWSRGIPETLAGAQLAITRMNQRVDGIMNLHAVPRVIVSRNAKINKSKLTNGWADILECNGSPQQAIYSYVPNSVPAEFLNQIDKLIAWAEKQVGLSEMSIAAQKPKGVDHAPGLQHLADTESIRHTTSFRSWEQFHLDAAVIIVDGLRMLAERNKDYEIIFGDAKDLKRIKWSDVDLGADRYHLKIWATNLLPQTPAAKVSRIMDMLGAKLISLGEARALLEFPDLEAVMGDANAEELNIQHKLDACVRGETDAATPHAYLNLDLALSMAKQRINRLEADGVAAETWDRVVAFWEMCNEMKLKATNMQAQAAQGMLPPGGGGGGAPPGGPGPGGALPPPGTGNPPVGQPPGMGMAA
jgi:hypothetical protein